MPDLLPQKRKSKMNHTTKLGNAIFRIMEAMGLGTAIFGAHFVRFIFCGIKDCEMAMHGWFGTFLPGFFLAGSCYIMLI